MYAGLSRVSLPFVGALGDETKDTNEEGMSVVDVDMEMMDEAEQNYKVRTSRAHYFFVQADREHRDNVSVLPCSPRKEKN